jgi:hypothetical protein
MKPSTSKTPKAKAAKQSTPKKETASKEAKSKKQKAPKEPQVVFAFRLTEAQRDTIHKAAGPGKASQFVLNAALALAKGDGEALQNLAAEAQSRLK